jgi:hypothetical protein
MYGVTAIRTSRVERKRYIYNIKKSSNRLAPTSYHQTRVARRRRFVSGHDFEKVESPPPHRLLPGNPIDSTEPRLRGLYKYPPDPPVVFLVPEDPISPLFSLSSGR